MLAFVKIGDVLDRSGFRCGVPELDRYFLHQAGQDERRNLSSVTVLIDGPEKVIGFYTLSQYLLTVDLFPRTVGKRLPPKRDVPCTLLGRLAVSETCRGEGFGKILLVHALRKAARIGEEVASFAVIVDAKDEAAAIFYERRGFVRFEDHALRLFIPLKDVKAIPE